MGTLVEKKESLREEKSTLSNKQKRVIERLNKVDENGKKVVEPSLTEIEKGSAKDNCDYGVYFLQVKQNFKEAVRFFSLAATQGDQEAQDHLSTCYKYGMGTRKDPNEATYYYRLAHPNPTDTAGKNEKDSTLPESLQTFRVI